MGERMADVGSGGRWPALEFGLEVGKSYTFDLFQAERQPTGSNFRLETTLSFTGCGVILPPDIIVK